MGGEPARILQVLSSLGRGGAETVVMNYYRAVDTSKLQFDFLLHKKVEDGYEEEALSRGGRIFYISPLGESGVYRYIRNVINAIERNGPFIAVHAHTDYQSGIVAIAAKLARINKRICHSHSTQCPSIFNKMLLPLYKTAISCFANYRIACGEEAGRFLFGYNKFKVLNNAIDISKYEEFPEELKCALRNQLNIPSSKIILGQIGRFVSLKNHVFSIDFLQHLLSRGLEAYLVFIGDGPLKSEIEDIVKQKQLDSYVIFLGTRDDVPKLLSILDVLLLPSLYEGIPMVVIEAQAARKPCIISDTISDEVDLGLGLVKFASLTSGFAAWESSLLSLLKSLPPSHDQTKSVFNIKGYDIEATGREIENIYL